VVFLAPLALLLALVLPVGVFVLHLLRGSRWRARVPATFLWEGIAPSVAGHVRQRLPRLTALFLLQLAVAASSGIVLARPATPLPGFPQHIVLVLDASASMRATDLWPNRFEVARARAHRFLSELQLGDRASLIRAGPSATVLASGAPEEVREALDHARPSAGTGALRDAIALASQLTARTPGMRGRILVFTDGAFPPLEPLGALAAPVEFVTVEASHSAGNQAIVNVHVRASPPAPSRRVASIELANFAADPATLPVRLLDGATGREFARRSLELPPDSVGSLVVELPPGLSRLAVVLDRSQPDPLSLDDQAEIDASITGTRPLRVLLVAPAPTPLREALTATPSVQLTVVTPAAYPEILSEAELVVFDSMVPSELPQAPVLIVNPPAGNRVLPVLGTFTAASLTLAETSHPLLRGVDLAPFTGVTGKRLARLPWARPVVATSEGPLILEGFHRGSPVVVFAFDPAPSGLDKTLAFPLLVGNAVEQIIAQQSDLAVTPGQPLTLPAPTSGHAVLVHPDGHQQPIEPRSDQVWIRDTEQVGRYLVLDGSDPQTVLASFSVNLFDRAESDIRPTRDLAMLSAASAAGAVTDTQVKVAVREWWRPLVVGLLVLLGIEWLLFARRG
jgi:hypothetical protein